jgi:glycosyltransferase involved in cell wall biosynthesis
MRIFYPLLCYFPSEAGGPANTIYWLNKAIGRVGLESIVISTKFGLPDRDIDKDKLFEKHNIKVEFISGTILSFFSRRIFKEFLKSDAVHFSSLFFKPTLFYVALALLFSKKIIISPRGELYPAALERKITRKRIYLKAMQVVQRKIHFHSTNPVELGLIKKYFSRAKSIIEIPNYIELPEKQVRKIIPQILYLGRINPIKNLHLLIEAYSRLPSRVKLKFPLLIAGEANLEYEKLYLQKLLQLIKNNKLGNNVQFIGGIYGNQKQKLLSESYFTILPSKSENFGNVVLESICQGTPVIVTKEAPWEIIEKYKAGFWITPKVTELTNKINQIISLDRCHYLQMRNNAYRLASSKFDINKHVNTWIEFYLKKLL